jgi:tol-pal system protein YbgF
MSLKKAPLYLGLGLLIWPFLVQAENLEGDFTRDEAGYAASTLENRVARLEKRLSGQSFVDMSGDIEKLQGEVKKLRGSLEELHFELEKTKKLDHESIVALEKKNTELEERLRSGSQGATPSNAPGATSGASESGVPTVPAVVTPPAPALATPPETPIPSVASAAPQDPADRKTSYQKAFDTLKQGKYNEAIIAFKAFVGRYPTGDLSDNAHYWLGEAYYVNRDFTSARAAFKKVISDFPQSPKVPDANLKLAFIEYENAQYSTAKTLLEDIIKRFPDSSAAKMAEKRLERMRAENR